MVIEKRDYRFDMMNTAVGDVLTVSQGCGDDLSKVTVTKVTKSRVTTSDGRQWMKESHRLVGGGQWCRTSLRFFNEAEYDEAAKRQAARRLVSELRETRFIALSLESLQRIKSVIDDELNPTRDQDTA